MYLNAVILVLQEILEAALLISVMLVLTSRLRGVWRTRDPGSAWVPGAVPSCDSS